MPVWLRKTVLAQQHNCICCHVIIIIQLLLRVSDWPIIIIIGPGGLLLVVPHLFALPVCFSCMGGVATRMWKIFSQGHILSTTGEALTTNYCCIIIYRLQPGYLAVLGDYPDWPIRVVEILVSWNSSIVVVVGSYCYYGKLLLQRSTTIVDDDDYKKTMHRTQVNDETKAMYNSAMKQLEGNKSEMSLLTCMWKEDHVPIHVARTSCSL
jgi:hypothetical protein